jgi:hypothetical protein
MPETALSAADHPLDSVEVEFIDRPEKGLGTDEAHRRRNLPQVVGPLCSLHVLDGCPHPDVLRPREPIRKTQGPLRSLGKHLELMPVRAIHHVENAPNKVE